MRVGDGESNRLDGAETRAEKRDEMQRNGRMLAETGRAGMRLRRFRGVKVMRNRGRADAGLLDNRLLPTLDEIVVLVRQRRENGKRERDGKDRGSAEMRHQAVRLRESAPNAQTETVRNMLQQARL